MPEEPIDQTPPEEGPASAGAPQDASGGPIGGEGLSQSDIDAALNQAAGRGAEDSPTEAVGADKLNQADIDSALEQAEAGDSASGRGAISSELSQADIDAALSGVDVSSAAQESGPTGAGTPAGGGAGSPQDEIDAMLAAAESLAAGPGEGTEPGPDADKSDEVLLDSAGRPFDEAAAAMAAAIADDTSAQAGDTAAEPGTAATQGQTPRPLDLKDFSVEEVADGPHDISILRDVNLKVHIELGRTHMYIEDVLKLTEGSVVELDNLAGDPVNVYVNGRLVARGEVLVLSDNFCVRISEILTGPQYVAVA